MIDKPTGSPNKSWPGPNPATLGQAKEPKQNLHLNLVDSIYNLNQLIASLLQLRSRIVGDYEELPEEPEDESSRLENCYSLHGVLTNGPKAIDITRDECLSLIQAIERLLF